MVRRPRRFILPRNRLFSSLELRTVPVLCGGPVKVRVIVRAWHAVRFWGGAPWVRAPLFFGSASSSFVPPGGLLLEGWVWGGWSGLWGGCGQVGCELHSGREHQESFFVVVLVRRPPSGPCPLLLCLVRGWGLGGGCCVGTWCAGDPVGRVGACVRDCCVLCVVR